MRGLSAVVTLLLFLLILISLSILFWFFTSGTIKALTGAGTERTTRTREILSTCMIVDSVHENKVYIKNCGDGVIVNDSLNVFMDDESLEFNMTPESIGKGEIGTVTTNILGINAGDHDLKISNPSLQIVQKVEAVLPDSIILNLEFDEGQGTTAYDKSRYGNDGTLGDETCSPGSGTCPKWTDGKFGKALEFDGINDYVEVSTNGMDTTKGAVTAWVKVNGPGSQPGYREHMFSHRVGSTNTRIYLKKEDGDDMSFSIGIANSPSINTGSDFVLNKWTHVALMWDNGNFYAYMNGSEVISGTYPSFTDLNPYIYLGIYEPNDLKYNFNGSIDSLRVYNEPPTSYKTINLKMK